MGSSKLILGLAAAAVALASGPANATVLFTGTGTNGGNPLSASADFSLTGTTLTIILSNTSTSNGVTETPTQTLSGLMFDVTGQSSGLTPTSAIANSIFNSAACTPSSACSGSNVNVGGEWGYQFTSGNTNLIGSAGYVTTGIPHNPGNFGGVDLDNQASLNGIDFAILAASHDSLNGGLTNAGPLVQTAVTLTLTGFTLGLSDITNVVFQYGTSLTEPTTPGVCDQSNSTGDCPGGGGPGPGVPEPATLFLLGSALLGYGAVRRRQQRPQS
jgi:hypothetical protein